MTNSNITTTPKQDLSYLLYDCSRLLRKRFDERIADLDLRESQWRIVALLNKSDGLSQTELALLVGVQKAPLGEHLDKLEAIDWIERRRDSDDRRINRIYLTKQAKSKANIISDRFNVLRDELREYLLDHDWQNLQNRLYEVTSIFAPEATRHSLSRLNVNSQMHLIGILSRQLRGEFDEVLKKIDLSRAQWQVVATIIDHTATSSAPSQKQLSELLDIAKAPLGQLIDELERKQWLLRTQDEKDRRINRLLVSPEVKNKVFKDYEQLQHNMASKIGQQRYRSLAQHLTQLREALLSLGLQQNNQAVESV